MDDYDEIIHMLICKWPSDTVRKWKALSHVSLFVTQWTVQPDRLLCIWNSPGKNTWMGSYSLLQGILSTQESNLGLPHCRQILYHRRQRYSLNLIKTLSTIPTHTCISSSELPKLSFMIQGSMLPLQVTTQKLGIKWIMLLIINVITFVAFNAGLTTRTITNACWYKSAHTPLRLCSHLWVLPLSTGVCACCRHVKHIRAHHPRRQWQQNHRRTAASVTEYLRKDLYSSLALQIRQCF